MVAAVAGRIQRLAGLQVPVERRDRAERWIRVRRTRSRRSRTVRPRHRLTALHARASSGLARSAMILGSNAERPRAARAESGVSHSCRNGARRCLRFPRSARLRCRVARVPSPIRSTACIRTLIARVRSAVTLLGAARHAGEVPKGAAFGIARCRSERVRLALSSFRTEAPRASSRRELRA
jgi:hypothetical protein